MRTRTLMIAILTLGMLAFIFATVPAAEPTDGTDIFADENLEGTHKGKCGDDVYWEMNKETGYSLSIWGNGDMYDYDSPESTPWHRFSEGIKGVHIGIRENHHTQNKVTSIGSYAFAGMENLTTVHFDFYNNGHSERYAEMFLEKIGDHAFEGCTSLRYINAVSECDVISLIAEFPYLSYIGESAFEKCNSLRIVEPKGTDMTIGTSAFRDCDSLTSVKFNDSVKVVGASAFEGCDSLTTFVSGYTLTTIGDNAFENCKSLSTINLSTGSGLKVGQFAFKNCTALTDVTFRNGVAKIMEGCFANTALEKIVLTKNLEQIGARAFEGCSSLKTVTIDDGMTAEKTAFDEQAFKDCTNLVAITLPINVDAYLASKDILSGCTGLKDVTLTAGDGTITETDKVLEHVWKYSVGTTLHIASDVEGIGNYQFYGSNNLIGLELLCSSSVGDYAFAACKNLKKVSIVGNPSLAKAVFSSCTGLTDLKISSNTELGYGTFFECTGLVDVAIPANAESLPESLFEGCTGLTKVIIPDSVTSIGKRAFRDCTGLKEVVISDYMEDLGSETFVGCTNLEKVTLGYYLKSIDDKAFEGCTGLKNVIVKSKYFDVTPGSDDNGGVAKYATNIDKTTVLGMNGSYLIYLNPTVKDCLIINEMSTEHIENLEIPSSFEIDGLTVQTAKIANDAFSDRVDMKSIVLGENVVTIGVGAFFNDDSLKRVTIKCEGAIVCERAFNDCNYIEYVNLAPGMSIDLDTFSCQTFAMDDQEVNGSDLAGHEWSGRWVLTPTDTIGSGIAKPISVLIITTVILISVFFWLRH